MYVNRSESTHPERDSPLNRIIPLMNLTFELDDRKYFLPTVENTLIFLIVINVIICFAEKNMTLDNGIVSPLWVGLTQVDVCWVLGCYFLARKCVIVC